MASCKAPGIVPLIEPVPVGEEFAGGLAFVEKIGDVSFLVFYVDQIPPPEIGSAVERRICRRMIMPNDALDRMARMLAK
jgi:hypothetical protein